MIEVKSSKDVDTLDVQEKAEAAKLYCEQASEYTSERGGKKWQYIIIPHDQISLSSSVSDLLGRNLL
jgi:type III restriction enzyme